MKSVLNLCTVSLYSVYVPRSYKCVYDCDVNFYSNIVDEIKKNKGSKSNAAKAAKMEKFGQRIIEFFSQNPDLDGDDLSLMNGRQFAHKMAAHCKDKQVKGITTHLRYAIFQNANFVS